MSFWYTSAHLLKGPHYRFRVKKSVNLNINKPKKKHIITVKFVRQQKVFGKGGGKALIKKKTNFLLRTIRLYFSTGVVQNLPPLSTLLSVYNLNSQKLCEELTNFFKSHFYESVPVIVLIDIFKDCTFKFFFLGFRVNFLLQSFFFDLNSFKNKIFLGGGVKFYFDLDLWFLLLINYRFYNHYFFFESFVRSLHSTSRVLGLLKIKNFVFFKV